MFLLALGMSALSDSFFADGRHPRLTGEASKDPKAYKS